MNKKKELTDTDIVNEFIGILTYHYQVTFTGYDTWINRENVKDHLLSVIKDTDKINAKLDAVELIVNGE